VLVRFEPDLASSSNFLRGLLANGPRGTMDEVSSHVRLDLPFVNGKAD
jgi:hypothetical protein